MPVEPNLKQTRYYMIYFTPFFCDSIGSWNTRKADEEPFRCDVDGPGGWSYFLLIKRRLI